MIEVKCTIIGDLLPLYVEGECTEDTIRLVEDHLAGCEECSEKYRNMSADFDVAEMFPEELMNTEDNKKRVQEFGIGKAFKKIRRRWILSIVLLIICMLIMIPVVVLGVNQYRGIGISYTNIGEVYNANRMLAQIKKGNYDEAFEYFDIEQAYAELIRPVESTTKHAAYTEAAIGNSMYYITEDILNNEYLWYITSSDSKAENTFWFQLYLSENYMIPEKAYDNMMEEYSDEINDEAIQISTTYLLVKYEDENYYLNSNYIDTSGDLSGLSNLVDMGAPIVPVQAYEEFVEQELLMNEKKEEWIAYYKAKGEEAYYKESKETFIRHMEELADKGYSITKNSVVEVFSTDSGDTYLIDMQLYLKDKEGNMDKAGLTLRSNKGKINFSGGFYKEETTAAGDSVSDLISLFNWY